MYASRVVIAAAIAAPLMLSHAAQSHAQDTASGAATPVPAEVVTVNGTVVDVDNAGRTLTLEAADGSTTVTTVGPQVANLANVKKGDHVTVKQIVPVVVSANPAAGGVATAKSQAKVDTDEISATVVSVDRSANTAVLRTGDGTTRTVKVQPGVLDEVTIGDSATLRITKAVAVAVDTAPAQ